MIAFRKLGALRALAAFMVLSASPDARAFSADTVSNLVLWYAADAGVSTDATGMVTGWQDQSASGNHATRLAGNAMFQAVYRNGKPGVRFDGASDALGFSRIADIRTVFWVLHEEAGTATEFRPVLGGTLSGDYDFHRGENKAIFGTYSANSIKNGATYVNGTSVGNGTGTTVPTNAAVLAVKTSDNAVAAQLGRDRHVDARTWNGVIAEVLIFNRVLTADELNTVGVYLSRKYAIATTYADTTIVLPQVANGGVSNVTLTSAVVDGAVVSTGVSATAAALCWGLTDGGTNAAAWSHTNSLGFRGDGPLSVALSDLTEDTLYFYTFVVSNAQGLVVAKPSRLFRTALDATRWNYRAKVRFTGYAAAEGLTNFPVLVQLGSHVEGFDPAALLTPPYGDLRFLDTNSVALNYDVEKWDAGGTSCVWVQIPALRGSNDFIWVYWGLRNATAPACTTNGATWSEGYGGVWHLSDSPANGGLQRDASPNGNHGTYYNASGSNTPGTVSAGVVAGGDYFAGDTGMLEVPHSASLQPLTAVSCEFWARSANPVWNRNGCLLAKRDAYMIHPNQSMSNQSFHVFIPGNNAAGYVSTTINEWHHYAGTFANGVVRFFIDGVQVGVNNLPPTDYTINPDTGPLYIGHDDYNDVPIRALHGWMDEVRVSGVGRSTNWIQACWSNQAPGSAFVTYGAAETVRKMQGVVLMIQ